MDTTAIIEAHATKCWENISRKFKIETVERCVEECDTGDPDRPCYVVVDTEALRRVALVHRVKHQQVITAALESPTISLVNPGEKDLLAHANGRKNEVWLISSQDQACVRAGGELGFLDRFVSLEEVARAVGIRASFRDHFTTKWLERLKTKIHLENL